MTAVSQRSKRKLGPAKRLETPDPNLCHRSEQLRIALTIEGEGFTCASKVELTLDRKAAIDSMRSCVWWATPDWFNARA